MRFESTCQTTRRMVVFNGQVADKHAVCLVFLNRTSSSLLLNLQNFEAKLRHVTQILNGMFMVREFLSRIVPDSRPNLIPPAQKNQTSAE